MKYLELLMPGFTIGWTFWKQHQRHSIVQSFLSTRQFQKHVALIQDKLIMPVCKNFEKHLDFNCEKIKRG